MLEPFASIVVNSILSSRSTLGHSPLQSIARTVVRPARAAFPSDFFTPHPRSAKGKEKELHSDPPLPCRVTLSSSLLDRGLRVCHVKDPSKRSRLLVAKGGIPRRDRPLRRHPSHHVPHLHHRRPCQLQIHIGITGHSRNGSTIAARSYVQHAEDNEGLRAVMQIIFSDNEDVDIDGAWEVYSAAANSGALSSLEHPQLLDFIKQILVGAEQLYVRADCDPDTLRLWGERLVRLLDDIPDTASSNYHVLRIRVLALAGNIDQAIADTRRLAPAFIKTNQLAELYDIVESIVHTSRIHADPIRTLEIAVAEKEMFEPFIANFPALHVTLAGIRDPTAALVALRGWERESRMRAGILLIKALIRRHLPDKAASVFEEMHRQRLAVPGMLQLHLVRVLGKARNFKSANRIYAGLPDTITPESRLPVGLQLFAMQGNIERTEDHYARLEKMGRIGSHLWAMRMHAYAIHGNTDTVVALFHELSDRSLDPNRSFPNWVRSIHYEVIVHAFSRAGDVKGVNEWLRAMTEAGFLPTIYVYSDVLNCLAKRGDVELVAAVLDEMRTAGIQPNHVSYTTVITLLAHRQDPVTAEAVYRRAIREGVVPDRQMITALMNAHVEAGSWNGAIRAFDYMTTSQHIRLTIQSFNTLLKAYVLAGAPFKMVTQFFVKLEDARVQPDEYTFALLIQSACDTGDMDAAADILVELERRVKEEGLRMTPHVMTLMMSGYLRIGEFQEAKAVYERMRQQGVNPTPFTFRTLLQSIDQDRSLGGVDNLERIIRALVTSEEIREKWTVPSDERMSPMELVYRPLMMVYAKMAKPDDVERLLREVQDAGGEITLGLLTALLIAYRRSENYDGVMKVWAHMLKTALRFSRAKYFFSEDERRSLQDHRHENTMCVAFSIYLDAMSTAGRHSAVGTAWKEMQELGFGFDADNWNQLAISFVDSGDYERAFGVVEKVILRYRTREVEEDPRDRNPDTPLSFENARYSEDDRTIPEPHAEAFRRTRERRWAVKVATFKTRDWLDDEPRSTAEGEDDIVQPLYDLQRAAPTWNTWKPHSRTLRALLTAVRRIQAEAVPEKSAGQFEYGHEQDHDGPRNDDDDHYHTHQCTHTEPMPKGAEEEINASDQARVILGRIYSDCPQTMRLVENFQVWEKRRLGANRFEKRYK